MPLVLSLNIWFKQITHLVLLLHEIQRYHWSKAVFQLLVDRQVLFLTLILFWLYYQKIYLTQVSVKTTFFRILFYQLLIYFLGIVCRKLTYFQLPFNIGSLVDFKLLNILKNWESNFLNDGGWAYIDLNTLNLSHKYTGQLSEVKNSNFFLFFFELIYVVHFCFFLFLL